MAVSDSANAAATAKAGRLHLIDDPVATLVDENFRAIPIAAFQSGSEISAVIAVKIGEDAIFIREHDFLPFRGFCSCFGRFRSLCFISIKAFPPGANNRAIIK